MGNSLCSIRDNGTRRRQSSRSSNISPATETLPYEITANGFIFAAATPYLYRPIQYDHHYYYHYPPQIYPHLHRWITNERYSSMPSPYIRHEKAVTIVNNVNLKKSSLRLEPDKENPKKLLVSFAFDSTVSGRITIVFFAKEDKGFNLIPTKEATLPPITFNFEKGLYQKFIQPSGTGIDLSVFEYSELFDEESKKTEIYPLAVKLEEEEEVANAEITRVAAYAKEKGEIKIGVVEQLLFVNGNRYEMKEIYGLENTIDSCNEKLVSNLSVDCVICLSEPSDTTVLPCRHMCMCSGCAKVLRFQTNQCPVCRQPVERLLEIQVNGNSHGRGDEQA
ncbi:unnamed protein product [Cochlearia groenlandica]